MYLKVFINIAAITTALLFICNDTFVLQPSPISGSWSSNTAVFLINLDKSTKRLENITPMLNGLPIKTYRVQAVEGDSLATHEVEDLVDMHKFNEYRGRFPKKGEIGCSLSHYKALKQFLASSLSFALILEDDVLFDPTQLTQILEKAIAHRKHWDVLAMQLNHRGLPVKTMDLDNQYRIVRYYGSVVESGAYLLNRKAAEAYINYFFPIKLPYDYFYTREWEMGIKFRGVEPRPVIQSEVKSVIDHSQDAKEQEQKEYGDFQWTKKLFNLRTAIARAIPVFN